MVNDHEEIEGLRVLVTDVVPMPHLETPEDRPHCFVYYLSISNETDSLVQVLARKWILKSGCGQTMVVEGHGVVGEYPVIPSGGSFDYHSHHIVATDTIASGSFFGTDTDGRRLRISIPSFQMKVTE